MRLCVYAICKNEVDRLDAWLEAVKEADEVVVLDTGSNDGSWELLKAANIKAYQKIITPWRFDTARNIALELIPRDCDICIPLDFDMSPKPGFVQFIKDNWEDNLAILEFGALFTKTRKFVHKFAHRRNGAYWVYPVYEQVRAVGGHKIFDDLLLEIDWEPKLEHKAYLPLVNLGLREHPDDIYLLKSKEIILRELEQMEE